MESKLLSKTFKIGNLEKSWLLIQANGRASKSEEGREKLAKFAENSSQHLRSLQNRLSRGTFTFGKAKGIPIPKLDARGMKTGKIRPIVLAPIETRIVQRALLNTLLEIPELQPYIKTKYSFGGLRKEKAPLQEKGSRAEKPAAVAAAIKGILNEIGDGARYVATADIRSFFTRISKSTVLEVIESAVDDAEFMSFLSKAVTVELENLAYLREHGKEFPTEDIGVAQGSSLSPLLGNIILADFDEKMNGGDCRCLRYIDDFIITAPSEKAANARLEKAKALLADLGMELSPEKSSKGGQPISAGFDFLGIHICPGLIRPSANARTKLLASVDGHLKKGEVAFRGAKNGNKLGRTDSLLSTLKKVDGIVHGWGMHYWFCNDTQTFAGIDRAISNLITSYLGMYADARQAMADDRRRELLGISELSKLPRDAFAYPTAKARSTRSNTNG